MVVCCLQFKTYLCMSEFGFFPPQNAFQSQPLQMPKEVEGLPFKSFFFQFCHLVSKIKTAECSTITFCSRVLPIRTVKVLLFYSKELNIYSNLVYEDVANCGKIARLKL